MTSCSIGELHDVQVVFDEWLGHAVRSSRHANLESLCWSHRQQADHQTHV